MQRKERAGIAAIDAQRICRSGGCLIEREVGGRVLGVYEFILYDSPQVSGGRLM